MKNNVVAVYTILCIVANLDNLIVSGFLGSTSKKLSSIRVPDDYLYAKSYDEEEYNFENDQFVPRNPISSQQDQIRGFLRNALVAGAGFAGFAKNAKAASLAGDVANVDLDKEDYEKALLNPPTDDFWYPPYLIGRWNTTMQFLGAKFTNDVPFELLAKDDNTPGFSKYSVIFTPNIGKDISNLILRYVQIDSHPREDHPFNLRNLVSAFIPSSRVVSDPYDFRKAPDWFHAYSNKWQIKYKDDETNEEGTVDLFTRKRTIKVFAGNVETTEFFRQTRTITVLPQTQPGANSTARPAVGSVPSRPIVTDYAINWKLFAPKSRRDEFITVAELSSTSIVEGQLNVLVYVQPTSDLYIKRGKGKPVGVFTYNVTMQRLLNGDSQESLRYNATRMQEGLSNETKASEYPFVFREDGPLNIDEYFGY